METLTLNKRKSRQQQIVLNVASQKYNFLMELLQNFDFVKVIEKENDGDSPEEIMANLKEAAKDLKLIKGGNLKGRPARELLNEF
jgi:hypothetical protein